MGCTSSRSVDVYNTKKPLRPVTSEDPHMVALTSSTYGFLSLDSHKKHSDDNREVDPVNQMYQKMMNIDAPGSQLPQSWSEVSNTLSQLKSEAQSCKGTSAKAQGKTELQAIDISDFLEDVDEEEVRPPPKANAEKRPVSAIRTLEEVDRMASVTEESSSEDELLDGDGHSNGNGNGFSQAQAYYASQKKQPRGGNYDHDHDRVNDGNRMDKRYSMSSVVSRSRSSVAETKPSRSFAQLESHGSTLFDPEFLASFQEAFEKLSGGVPSSDEPRVGSKVNKIPQAEVVPVQKPSSLRKWKTASDVFQLPASEPSPTKEVAVQRVQAPKTVRGEVRVQARVEDAFVKFEKICPPGGEHAVVFYSTSLRGIRKTFEDCNTVRSIVQSFNVDFDERDVSLDSTYRQQLKELMEKPVPVPRLFVKGRYLGGADDVVRLHENGTLAKLLAGMPAGNLSKDCDGCGGVRFIPCTDCNGSRKVVKDGSVVKCPDCNENGLARCPICS